MDPCIFFVTFKSRPEPWIFTQNHRNPRRVSPFFTELFETKIPTAKFSPSITPTIIPQQKSPKSHLQKHHRKNHRPQTIYPKKTSEVFFLPPKKRSLNCWGFLSTSGRRRGGHVQSTNAGGIGRERYTQQNLLGVPKMVGFPPFHTPKWSFLVGKPMGLLGKPTILGNPQVLKMLQKLHGDTSQSIWIKLVLNQNMYNM